MAKGGKREGAGRKPGQKSAKTEQRIAIADKAASEGITPLEYMLNIMRTTEAPPDASPGQVLAVYALRFEAAKAAAPYMHPRLAAVDHTTNGKDVGQTSGVLEVPPTQSEEEWEAQAGE